MHPNIITKLFSENKPCEKVALIDILKEVLDINDNLSILIIINKKPKYYIFQMLLQYIVSNKYEISVSFIQVGNNDLTFK